MAKKKTNTPNKKKQVNTDNVIGLHSEVTAQPITETLETNYMPYAMSTNVSRAFPEIDGFKPSHRKLLYTMYKMGLLNGNRTKSANIVGQTMKLNPHGDAAIYETMVRLATGNEALLAPFVESKGNFGKYYSGDLTYAASRYTEAKLSPICAEIFKDIDKDPVDFVDSYDGAMKEPRLLPTTFPNILVSANKGIGVAMASDICGFNLNEVCCATMHFLEDPSCDLLEYMPMPDFSTGGEIIYRREEMERIIETGLGSFQIRSRWRWVPEERIIEVYEIPYTTKTDVIIDRIIKLSKEGKVREIADIRDETDRTGMRIVIEVRHDANPQVVLNRLFAQTQLQTSFAINMLALVDNQKQPKILSLRHIIDEYLTFQEELITRRTQYDLKKAREREHLLQGLLIAQDNIDEVIHIIRTSYDDAKEKLMERFSLSDVQAQAILDMRLKALQGLDREKLQNEYDELEKKIAYFVELLSNETMLKGVLKDELIEIRDK